MTIDITDAALMDRQHRMMGCGVMVVQIAAMMAATDDKITKAIEDGRKALATATGEKAERIAKMLRAFEIEAKIRATA